MIRTLQYLNLVGILALGILSVAQWRMNQQLNLEINRFEQLRIDQSRKLDERDMTIAGYIRDLEELREHLTRLTGEQKETATKLRLAEQQSVQLTAERDQLKQSVKEWAEAVAARDEQLKLANQHIQELSANCNEAVLKYNDLADQYNTVVKELNERTRQFNELVVKYNEMAKR